MRTLCIDIGGTGIKAIVLDPAGVPLGERRRVPTPRPSTPAAVVAVLQALAGEMGEFDRISLGFPGVVREGTVRTAPHLDPSWAGFPLARHLSEVAFGKPARVVNDAVIHGLGVIEGKGLEAVITLGTGLGCCLFNDGRPFQLELGHHPCAEGKDYEALIGDAALKEVGPARWNEQVRRAMALMEALFNHEHLYIGGGNARLLERESLPSNVTVIDNDAGVLGGILLWR